MRETIRKVPAVPLAGALLLLGCGGFDEAMRRAEAGGLATATVESVDLTSRHVTLRDAGTGDIFVVIANPEVPHLRDLSSGETVRVEFVSSMLVAVGVNPADPDAPVFATAARLSRRQAAILATMTATLVSYDDLGARVTFRTPDGLEHGMDVPWDLRPVLEQLKPGARVLVKMTEPEAFAISPVAAR